MYFTFSEDNFAQHNLDQHKCIIKRWPRTEQNQEKSNSRWIKRYSKMLFCRRFKGLDIYLWLLTSRMSFSNLEMVGFIHFAILFVHKIFLKNWLSWRVLLSSRTLRSIIYYMKKPFKKLKGPIALCFANPCIPLPVHFWPTSGPLPVTSSPLPVHFRSIWAP